MRRYDVCRLKSRPEQLVVILQDDIINELETRIVAPLSDQPLRKLIADMRFAVEFEGTRFVVQVDRLAAIHRRDLVSVAGTLAHEEARIKKALDLVFFGV